MKSSQILHAHKPYFLMPGHIYYQLPLDSGVGEILFLKLYTQIL